MKTNEEWRVFERLADPELPQMERKRLEALVASDKDLLKRYEAFQALSEWPKLESTSGQAAARARLTERLLESKEEAAVELDLGRLFPVFFGGAVAAALVLAALNFWQFDELADGSWEAFFGMPAETIESAMVTQL